MSRKITEGRKYIIAIRTRSRERKAKNAMDIWLLKAFHTLLTSEGFVRRCSVKKVS